jgi:uridine kinase
VHELPAKPFLIGVAGGSSSGKTTVAERLAELAGEEHLALLKLDSYYVPLDDLPREERESFDYDHPEAFDWALLNDHIAALVAGAPVPVPVYDYVEYTRSGDVRVVKPAQIVVVEGILVLWEPTLRERFDLKVFVDTDADVRLIRRLRRDVAERGRTAESVIEQYLATVRPAHEQFIEPSKRYADVIVPQGGLNRPALDVLVARVRELAVDVA